MNKDSTEKTASKQKLEKEKNIEEIKQDEEENNKTHQEVQQKEEIIKPKQKKKEEEPEEIIEPVLDPEFTNLLYFSDDKKYGDFKRRVEKALQYYPHEFTMNMWYFLEAFILNFLHMAVLGPLIWILSVYKPYINYFWNMEFLGASPSYILSLFIWIINVFMVLNRFYWDHLAIDYGYLLIPLFAIIFRSACLASKFATFTPRYRRRMMGIVLNKEEIEEKELLGGWSDQEHHFAETEIVNSMVRKSIDDSTFKVSFIVMPSDEAMELLDEIKNENQAMGETRVQVDFMNVPYFDCKTVLYSLIKFHHEHKNGDWVFMIFIFLSIFWALCPGISRIMLNYKFSGDNGLETSAFFIGIIFYALIMIFNSIHFITAYFDYDRIIFCLEQLSQMYSPDNLTSVRDKILPTVNLADAVSLQGWINMRKVLLSYGAPYFNRHQIIGPTLLALAALSAAGLFTLQVVESGLDSEENFLIQAPLSFSFVFFGGMFLMLLRKSQLINDQCKIHIELLRENQQIFQTFHHFRDFYIGEMEDRELPYKVRGIFTQEPQSFVHQKMAEEARRLIGDKHEICNEYIEKLVEMQEEFITEIETDFKFGAESLFGFNVNFALVGAFFVAYCVIIFYGYFWTWFDKLSIGFSTEVTVN